MRKVCSVTGKVKAGPYLSSEGQHGSVDKAGATGI